jgi:hypothetical protein
VNVKVFDLDQIHGTQVLFKFEISA